MTKGAAELVHQAIMEESDFGVPTQDSADNANWGDVIGNKTDTVGGDSLVALIKSAGGGGDSHLPLFTGNIYYVDAGRPDDTGGGQTPETAKKTIAAGLALMSAGDALTIKAGTYTDVGLDFNLDAMEIWCEIGVTFDPAAGTALTLSGDYCRVKGNHNITPAAGQIALLVTGDGCIIEGSTIIAGATGVQVTGSGCQFWKCAVGFQTAVSYDIQGIQTRLWRCNTVGSGATVGYQISGGVDTGVLEDCTSTGHTTAGFSIGAGSSDWTIKGCTSGGGDGRRVDLGTNNVWPNFSPDEHNIQFGGTVWYIDATNGAATNDGLTPITAYDTIGAATAVAAAGDAISIKAGTYTENVTMALAGLELWGEIGTVIVGTVTMSAATCRLRGVIVSPAAGNAINLTGNTCKIEDVQTVAGVIGFNIDSVQNIIIGCIASGYSATGYDIANYNVALESCLASGRLQAHADFTCPMRQRIGARLQIAFL